MKGQHPEDSHYDPRWLLRGRDANVFRPDGTLLLALRVARLMSADLKRARDPLFRIAKPTNHRPDAQGSNEVFNNNAAGFLDGRRLAFARDHPEEWRALLPLLIALDGWFREQLPEQYAVLERAAADTPLERLIRGTAFTTVTANRDHTGIHTDGRNLDGGYGVMTAIRSKDFAGGLFVLPKYRIAVDLLPGDVLIVDNQEYHGNALFLDGWRITAVAYFHKSNLPSGHPLR